MAKPPFPKDPFEEFEAYRIKDAKGVNIVVRRLFGQKAVAIPNIFLGSWECDVWMVEKAGGRAREFEIKVSAGDFRLETEHKNESKSAKYDCYARKLAELPGRTLTESTDLQHVPSEFNYVLFNGHLGVDDWGWKHAPEWCGVFHLIQKDTPTTVKGDKYLTRVVQLRKGRPIHGVPAQRETLMRALSSVASRYMEKF